MINWDYELEIEPIISPRPYQKEALNKVVVAYQSGITRQLISLPTGCGKTIIFGLVAKEFHTRTLIVAHREELLYQAEEKIHLVYPNARTGILKAREKSGLDAEICIASIQTAIRHTEELAERGYKLLICDEAHHAVSDSYMSLFTDLGFIRDDPEKLLLGVTATPYRTDELGLNNLFQEIVFERSIMTMMQAGYLCDLKGLRVFTGEDISTVHMQTGDFAVNELSAKVDIPKRNELIADTYLKYGEGRHGVVFCVNVSHAQHLAEAFRAQGISCEAIYGDMPTEERQDILSRYANHEVQMLTNCAVLTEGWDVPDTDIIMMARPTQSRGLYVQCAGRGLRIAPTKSDCLLVDFVDICQKHDLCTAGILAGKAVKLNNGESILEAVKREAKKRQEQLEASTDIDINPQIEEFDIFNRSQYRWHKYGVHFRLSLVGKNSLVVRFMGEGKYKPIFLSSEGETTYLNYDSLSLEYAMGVCEDYVRRLGRTDYLRNDAAWRNAPATDKQKEFLMRNGITFSQSITKGEADILMQSVVNQPITPKQLYFIKKHNLHACPDLLNRYEASKRIKDFKARENLV